MMILDSRSLGYVKQTSRHFFGFLLIFLIKFAILTVTCPIAISQPYQYPTVKDLKRARQDFIQRVIPQIKQGAGGRDSRTKFQIENYNSYINA